jgi:2-aminoadipate transaminase
MELSREVSHLKRSVMRDLLALATAPDLISLAGGLPASELLPLREYQECLNTVLNREGARVMQYSPPLMPLRRWIADYMATRGVSCTPEQVFITAGNQQGLAILSRLLLDPGDSAVIEQITFTGVQQVTAGRGVETITVPTDLQTGVDTDALEAAFKRRPRFAIIIPDFHNPLGVSLSAEKRQRIAELAARYNVAVIEDDPYSALRFEGAALPPIKAYDEGGKVFYLGSFSKMLAPAMRLGWIVAPPDPDLGVKLTVVRESFDLESSILTQHAIYEFLSRGLLTPHLERMTSANKERRDALLGALETHLGGIATWTQPQGGLFVWVTLPEVIDTWEMFQQAVDRKVVYIPGSAFDLHGGHRNTMRLNFSNTKPEKIREAIMLLADVIHAFQPVL